MDRNGGLPLFLSIFRLFVHTTSAKKAQKIISPMPNRRNFAVEINNNFRNFKL